MDGTWPRGWVRRQRRLLELQAKQQRQDWEDLVEQEEQRRWNTAAKPDQRMEEFEMIPNEFFERFVKYMMPVELREGAPVPATWRGSAAEWEGFRAKAEAVERDRLSGKFAEAIALHDFTPEQLASGENVERYQLSGKVKQRPEPTLPAQWEADAVALLHGLATRRIQLDTIQQYKLEQVAGRRWRGAPEPIESLLQEAKTLIEGHDAHGRMEVTETAAQPILHVLWDFPALGQKFVKGDYRITQEFADRLMTWGQATEAQAKGRTLTSLGFPQWPTFTISMPRNGEAPAPAPSPAKVELAHDPQALPMS